MICNGKIHLNHFEYGTLASPKHARSIPLVGYSAFENPSPNWKISTLNCLEIPSKSPSGTSIGIVSAACPEPDETKKFINMWIGSNNQAATIEGRPFIDCDK